MCTHIIIILKKKVTINLKVGHHGRGYGEVSWKVKREEKEKESEIILIQLKIDFR